MMTFTELFLVIIFFRNRVLENIDLSSPKLNMGPDETAHMSHASFKQVQNSHSKETTTFQIQFSWSLYKDVQYENLTAPSLPYYLKHLISVNNTLNKEKRAYVDMNVPIVLDLLKNNLAISLNPPNIAWDNYVDENFQTNVDVKDISRTNENQVLSCWKEGYINHCQLRMHQNQGNGGSLKVAYLLSPHYYTSYNLLLTKLPYCALRFQDKATLEINFNTSWPTVFMMLLSSSNQVFAHLCGLYFVLTIWNNIFNTVLPSTCVRTTTFLIQLIAFSLIWFLEQPYMTCNQITNFYSIFSSPEAESEGLLGHISWFIGFLINLLYPGFVYSALALPVVFKLSDLYHYGRFEFQYFTLPKEPNKIKRPIRHSGEILSLENQCHAEIKIQPESPEVLDIKTEQTNQSAISDLPPAYPENPQNNFAWKIPLQQLKCEGVLVFFVCITVQILILIWNLTKF